MNKRTVVFVAPYFPPHMGGMERYVYEIATRIGAGSEDVHVITTSETHSDSTETLGTVTVHRLSYSLCVSNTPVGFLWPIKLYRLLRTLAPDIVNVHTPVPGLGDIAALLTPRQKLVVTYHAGSMKKGRVLLDALIGLYETLCLPVLLHRARRVVATSDALAQNFLKSVHDKITVIPPAVDTDFFTPGHHRDTALLFVASGLNAADAHKGLDTLIKALPAVVQAFPTTTLTVVGKGDGVHEYRAQAESLNVASHVYFVGAKTGHDLAEAYRGASLFVLPTRNDNFPLVILEALSSGVPVISTMVGSIPSMIEDGKTGYIIPTNDPVTLAKKIRSLFDTPELLEDMRIHARAQAQAKYSWEKRVNMYRDTFGRVLEPLYVHLVGYYPPHIGGMEKVAQVLAREMAKYADTRIISTSGTLRKTPDEKEGNLTVTRLRSFEFAHTPVAPGLLFSLFSLPHNSVMHLHLAQAFWPELVLLVSRMRRIPYVVHVHLDVAPSGVLGPLFTVYKKLIWKPLFTHASHVVVCTPELEAMVTERYTVPKSRVSVHANAVDSHYITGPRTYTHGLQKLLYVGRLAPQKRLTLLVEALSQVKHQIHLTIVGDGEEREELEALVKKFGLTSVTFAGTQDERAVRDYLDSHDAFILTSEREGRPLAVLEAMARGLPVIGTDVVGLRSLLAGVGILVHSDPASVAAAIDDVAEDSQKLNALSRASIGKAREDSWEVIARSMHSLYQGLV